MEVLRTELGHKGGVMAQGEATDALEAIPNLIGTQWLAERLGNPRLQIIDVSWSMAAGGRDARQDWLRAHIPGSVFLDLDAASDPAARLPHTLAPAAHFSRVIGALGISGDDAIVVYDAAGIATSPRAWWMFKAYGHERVAVLDGGLRKWRIEGRRLEQGAATRPPSTFFAGDAGAHVCGRGDVVAAPGAGVQVVDARSEGRYSGREAEPRPGLRSGHIPGSLNLPYTRLLNPEDGTLRSTAQLRKAFLQAKVDLERPVICTCGSGVTACIVRLALAELGVEDAQVYDGSWSEWGSMPELAIEVGH